MRFVVCSDLHAANAISHLRFRDAVETEDASTLNTRLRIESKEEID
jgi:hypothetical protein